MSEEVFFKAICNDEHCQATMYLTSHYSFVDCFHCGQTHDRDSLQNIQQLDESGLASLMQQSHIINCLPKRGPDMVKVLGMSNYFCKLLSPFLTTYGMDRSTGQPVLLKDMGRGDIFNCNSLSSRAYLIDRQHIPIQGFGRDVTGSMDYLSETLQLIKNSNGGEERLLPIYADGDGHCLVHAISRALVGRELFWHPLRSCLKRFFESNLDKFKELFENFIDIDEWPTIIDECDPDFQPPEGDFHGLRNIHIFGLANVLRRPIILLDSWECMNKSGDYSGLFLPGFIPPNECRGDDNTLNKPICIAWSSKSHNHYIPLVGIVNMPLPVLPRSLFPSVFRMSQSDISSYIEFDEDDKCVIGGSRVLSETYMKCLVFAIQTQFARVHGVDPFLVADARHFLYYKNVFLNTSPAAVIRQVRNLANEGFLFRCTSCTALCELHLDQSLFRYNGLFYNMLVKNHKKLVNGVDYVLPLRNENRVLCKYDSRNDAFIPDLRSVQMDKCSFCDSPMLDKIEPYKQHISNNPTSAESDKKSVPDPPQLPRIKVQWNDSTIEDVIPDFQDINEDVLAEAVDMIARSFVKKHFTGEMADQVLQSYISGEIYNKIGKTPTTETPSTDSAPVENTEMKSDELKTSATTVDEDESLKENQPQPSTSQTHTVKLVSVSGHQVTLTINEKGISYSQLQEIIQTELGIPAQNQRIKTGFPPKVLEPPHGNEAQALSLKHGDRLIVENCPVQETKRFVSTPYTRNNTSLNRSTESQSEIWKSAKLQPHLFKKGGQYFEEANEKHILYDLVHVVIDSFPSKHFSYNALTTSLELCVKPYGHFEICVDMDGRIEQVSKGEMVRGYRGCPIMCLKPGRKELKASKPVDHSSTTIESIVTPQASTDVGRLRKGPGFSVLTSPKPSDMDVS